MVETLLVALIYIAIIVVIGWVVTAVLRSVPGLPALVPTIIWAVIAIICLVVLLQAVTGGLGLNLSG